KLCGGGLLLAVLGCSRSAAVVTAERSWPAEEPVVAIRPVTCGPEDETNGAGFQFPDDAGGTLLAKLLPPSELEEEGTNRTNRLCPFPRLGELGTLSLPLLSSQGALPHRPARTTTVALRPRMVMEEPLADFSEAMPLPSVPVLPAGERIRVPSVDVHQPIP